MPEDEIFLCQGFSGVKKFVLEFSWKSWCAQTHLAHIGTLSQTPINYFIIKSQIKISPTARRISLGGFRLRCRFDIPFHQKPRKSQAETPKFLIFKQFFLWRHNPKLQNPDPFQKISLDKFRNSSLFFFFPLDFRNSCLFPSEFSLGDSAAKNQQKPQVLSIKTFFFH